LIAESEGIAATAIRNLGINLETLRFEVLKHVKHEGDTLQTGEIQLSPSGKRAIELAGQEAQGFGHNYIGTEHLLLGVIRESEGIAARVLLNMGIDLVKARARFSGFWEAAVRRKRLPQRRKSLKLRLWMPSGPI
jgi:ATP-dependent Clp protease ATP-binding subunit ClpC